MNMLISGLQSPGNSLFVIHEKPLVWSRPLQQQQQQQQLNWPITLMEGHLFVRSGHIGRGGGDENKENQMCLNAHRWTHTYPLAVLLTLALEGGLYCARRVEAWAKLQFVCLKCGCDGSSEGRWGVGVSAKCHRSSWRRLMSVVGTAMSPFDSGQTGTNHVELQKTAAFSRSASQLLPPQHTTTTTTTSHFLLQVSADLTHSFPAVWCSPCPATKACFADINMVMIGEGAPQASDHCFLATLKRKLMKSNLLGLEVKNTVHEARRWVL